MDLSKYEDFKPEDYLNTPEDVKAFLMESLEQNDTDEFIEALGIVSRSKGMKQISTETGLSYQSLYKTFMKGKQPRFSTITNVLNALGLKLSLTNADVKTA